MANTLIKHFFFTLILVLSISVQSQAQEGTDYNSTITSADVYYQNKDYYNAKAAYQLASKLKPDEAYPKEQIAAIISILKAEMAVRGEYDQFIELADQAFNQKDYTTAIANYKKALALISYETRPQEQLKKAEELKKAALNKDKAYNEAIKLADASFINEAYEEALGRYKEAASIDADQKYPNDRIIEITNILRDRNAQQMAYEQAIVKADQQLNYEKFSEALSFYEEALSKKPEDAYAVGQIAKMKSFMKKEKEYDEIVKNADALYMKKDFKAAKTSYQEAQAILPEKTYAANMIAKIETSILKEQQRLNSLDEEYNSYIEKGDKLFDDKKYQVAYSKYSKALELKPNMEYPKERLFDIDILLSSGHLVLKFFIHENNEPLFDSRIQLMEDDEVIETVEIGSKGKHEMKLALDHDYEVIVFKDRYIHKIFTINTNLPREVNHNNIYKYDLTVELFKACETDLSLFDRPLAEIKYYGDKGNFYYDEQRARIMLNRISNLEKECEELLKEDEKRSEYEDAIAKADKDYKEGNYKEAIAWYNEASSLIPSDEYPIDKIDEIEEMLASANKYESLIASADAKFKANKLEEALYDYYAAKNLETKKTYPNEKIAEIDAILKEKKQVDDQYSKYIAQADSLYQLDSLSLALESYQTALGVKSMESYPAGQLTLIKKELQKRDETNKEYKAAISKADDLFEAGKLNEAKVAYITASQIKVDVMYPKYKIEDINTIEEQRRMMALDNDYEKLIAEADKSFENKSYSEALPLYQQAAKIKPKESYPPAQIEKINAILVEQAAQREKYDVLIASADQKFIAKEYAPSFDDYKEASLILPDESYPRERMAEIEAIMKELEDLDLAYQEAIAKGDAAFETKEWDAAKLNYTKAKDLKPNETYPPEKLAEIEALLKSMADADAQYAVAIEKADQHFEAKEWELAITAYNTALTIKPEEEYPPAQIAKAQAELDAILQAQADADAKYAAAIEKADQHFEAKEWELAIAAYNTALTIKPDEEYPPAQIAKAQAELDALLQAQADADAKYAAAIEKADQHFEAKEWEPAITAYNTALTIKPDEEYPPAQIAKAQAELDALLQAQADADAKYAAAIEKADQHFEAKEWELAITAYNTALTIKPDEEYPPAQIAKAQAEIDALLQAQADADAKYAAAIEKADQHFEASEWELAITAYNTALTIKPDEEYPPAQIAKAQAELDALLQAQADADAKYAAAIEKADQHFEAKEWELAIAAYNTALTIKPDEEYPPAQIAKAQAELDALLQAQADADAKYAAAIEKADQHFEAKEWEPAITAYNTALTIKPEEEYPPAQIAKAQAELDALLQAQADADAQYAAAIEKADQHFEAKEWEPAIAAYNTALTIKPDEEYPPAQIAKAQIELDALEKDVLYAQYIKSADDSFANKEYQLAISDYKQASEIKPEEAYPLEKIKEIEALLMALAEKDRLYTEAIAEADKSRDIEAYPLALTKYKEASTIKPEEAYPIEQMALIQAILDKLANQANAYDQLIASADAKFEQQAWEEALGLYRQSLEIKPDEVYPKNKIQEIEDILQKLAEKNEAYQKAISDADAFYEEENWLSALDQYQLASQLKPEEAYPKERIAELNDILGEMAAKEAKYKALIAEADSKFIDKDYVNSKAKYQEALAVKPEGYPQQRIKEIDEILAQLAADLQAYNKLIEEADALFTQEDWTSAIEKYQAALAIMPNEVYPQEQIQKINNQLQNMADKQANYDALIAEADRLFEAKDYESALSKYESASVIYPEETYPPEQMAKIRSILAALAEQLAAYDKLIAQADDLFVKEKLEESKALYQQASAIFTQRDYPKEQIAKIDELIDKNSRYATFISQADALFEQKDYQQSLTNYEQALAIFAKEHPRQRIEEIKKILTELSDIQAAYDEAIRVADLRFKSNDYKLAKQGYTEALSIISTEEYPRQKIMEIDQILQDLARKRQVYDELIVAADASFNEKSYELSLGKYKEALSIFPQEAYPQQKIDEINRILSAMAAKKAKYDQLISQGDEAFGDKDYKNCISLFEEALLVFPDKPYPPQRIEEAKKALAQMQKDVDLAYQNAIALGDKGFNKRNWDKAKTHYQEASAIKPEELYPKEKLAEINSILEKELIERQKQYDRYIADGDRFYSTKYYQESVMAFENALSIFPDEKYPADMIEKIFDLIKKNSMVTILDHDIRILNKEKKTFEFSPIAYKDRKENFLLLEVKVLDENAKIKLYVSFGKGGGNSGGYSINLKYKDGYSRYFVNIGRQTRWVSQDNNILRFIPEGGDVDIKLIKISRRGL